MLDELHRITPYDPDHMPREIELIEAFRQRHPQLPQVACFDTAFHRTMPRVAKMLPIPRRYEAKGVQRYGFHGLSYTGVISTDAGRVVVRVIRTDKEQMIARSVYRALGLGMASKKKRIEP